MKKKVGIIVAIVVVVVGVAGVVISVVNHSHKKDAIEQGMVENMVNLEEESEEESESYLVESVSDEETSEVETSEETAAQDESFEIALSEAHERVKEEINTEGVVKAEPLTNFERWYMEYQHDDVDEVVINSVPGIDDSVAVAEVNYVFVANGYSDYELVETYYDEMNDEWTYTLRFDNDYWFIVSNREKAYSMKDDEGYYLQVQTMEESVEITE